MLIRKHIALNKKQTTIALEAPFWLAIENLAGQSGVNTWIADQLKTKPATERRASWLRQRIVISCEGGGGGIKAAR